MEPGGPARSAAIRDRAGLGGPGAGRGSRGDAGRPDGGRRARGGRGEADAGRPLLGGGVALTPSWVVSAAGWSARSPARNHGEEGAPGPGALPRPAGLGATLSARQAVGGVGGGLPRG